jgi:hypothetical protein
MVLHLPAMWGDARREARMTEALEGNSWAHLPVLHTQSLALLGPECRCSFVAWCYSCHSMCGSGFLSMFTAYNRMPWLWDVDPGPLIPARAI